MAYTKAELVDEVAGDSGADKATVERVLKSFFETIVTRTSGGDKVAWPGFGSFSTRQVAARTARNPRTGATVKVPAQKKMAFSASSTLKERLNAKGGAKKAAAKKAASAKKAAPAKKATAKKAAPAKKAAKKR